MSLYEDQIQTMIKVYFPVLHQRAFLNHREELEAWFRFVDLLCMLVIYENENRQESFLGDISRSELVNGAVAALEPFKKESSAAEELKEIYWNLRKRGELARKDGEELFAEQLVRIGNLEPAEVMAFFILASVDYDGKYAKVFECINGRRGSTRPSLETVLKLLVQFMGSYEEIQKIILDENRMFRSLFCQCQLEALPATQAVPSIHQMILDRMRNAVYKDSLEPEAAEEEVIIAHEEQITHVAKIISHVQKTKGRFVINLTGAEGIGKKFTAKMAAMNPGGNLLVVNARRLNSLKDAERENERCHIALKCLFDGLIPYIDASMLTLEEESVDKEKLMELIAFLEKYLPLSFLGTKKYLSLDSTVQSIGYAVELKVPGCGEQERFWELFGKEYNILYEADIEFGNLVSKYDLTPAKIRHSLQCVCAGTEIIDGKYRVFREQLEKQIRMNSGVEFGIYAAKIDSHYTLEDICLTELGTKKFKEACNRVKYRSVVNETYGFKKKLVYGRGIAIVFYGPPGTGKTMAAQVMANELGLDIYRIDISQIVNKYIGETQKNIGKVFEVAKNSNAILFFDEADALFGKRTEVSNSNDMHANSETAFLLQKIEENPGVCILATNAVNNMDSAFKRRMTYMIEIGQPDEATRLKIWKNIFAENVPFAETIHFEAFASIADQLTGSGIKSAALTASYYAAAEERGITNWDIIQAIDSEYVKSGRLSILDQLYSAM